MKTNWSVSLDVKCLLTPRNIRNRQKSCPCKLEMFVGGNNKIERRRNHSDYITIVSQNPLKDNTICNNNMIHANQLNNKTTTKTVCCQNSVNWVWNYYVKMLITPAVGNSIISRSCALWTRWSTGWCCIYCVTRLLLLLQLPTVEVCSSVFISIIP